VTESGEATFAGRGAERIDEFGVDLITALRRFGGVEVIEEFSIGIPIARKAVGTR
jgi:hypothetical protein